MKNFKQMIFGSIFAIAACGAIVIGEGNICQAAGNTYKTAKEALYGETFKSVFNEKIAGSPIEGDAPDGVDTANGHLVLSRTDLYLEGTGGMDFELGRYYDSNEAIIGNPTVQTVDVLPVDTVYVYCTTHDGEQKKLLVNTAILKNHKKALKDMMASYEVGEPKREDETETDTQRTKILSKEDFNVYGLASGWKFDLPWIETIAIKEESDDQWSARPAYLHFGSRGTMEIETKVDDGGKCYPIKGLAGYSYDDVKLEDWQKEVEGIRCRYLLRDKTGMRTYFNEDGVVVLQRDAHDNKIAFSYTDKIYLKKVTDSVGRTVNFHYEEGEAMKHLASVTVEGNAASSANATLGGVTKKTITYAYEERTYTPHNSDTLNGLVLKSATVDGSKETYGYRIVERLMSTSGRGSASQRVSTNESYLINKVTVDGNIQHYEYRANVIRGARDADAGQERDVVVPGYYVTREYSEDQKTGKKSEGLKYDFFQKQNDTLLRFCDFKEDHDEIWQYGREGLRTVALVSSFNPNKYKTNKKMSDYIYKKSHINLNTLRLKKNTKKDVSVYIYNSQKLLVDEVGYGEEKEETLYSYDKDGKGSLVVLETEKSFGSKGSGTVTTKWGYAFDKYRNLLSNKKPAAYLKKNAGKEKLYTIAYTYADTDKGYPAEDTPFSLCTLVSEEQNISANTTTRLKAEMAGNGIDYDSIQEQRRVKEGEYRTLSKTKFQYDDHGNEIQGKSFPAYQAHGEKEAIQNDYAYNNLGQQTQTKVTIASAKRPEDNRTYIEEETTFDSFGNELTYTDADGLISKTSYDPETGEETECTEAVGTEHESKEKEYVSTDQQKTMSIDESGNVSIEIQDAFGNVVISKDEKEGTWTESVYEYGSNAEGDVGSASDDSADEEKQDNARLIEERTYTFSPEGNKFIVNENGETVANFYISGRGKEILSGSKYFYDALGNEIGSAEFSNGELDAAHCTSWSFSKSETEVIGEEDEAQSISISHSKELNPSAYQSSVDAENYYDQFNDAVLSESIVKTITDAEGNALSETSTFIRGENKSETVTTYETDDFGRTIQENTTTRNHQEGKWLPAYETQSIFAYDDDGNISQTETRSRKEGDAQWQSRTVRTDYDDQGNAVREYTPRGVKDNAAAKYDYDILGRMIYAEIPQEKKDGGILYQKTETKYDNGGRVTEKEEQVDGDRKARAEYTYDKSGNLSMVKNYLEDGKEPGGSSAQYVQYVYDTEGNKVRQFTGMTSPLEIAVSEADGSASDGKGDTFACAGKKYCITVSGKKKSDVISEEKYEYNSKNDLVSYTDPEGRTETYAYDANSNLTKTVDKNGNTLKNTYDYQNRLTEMVAKEKKTGKETSHTYTYNAYGEVATRDDTVFAYGDVSGQVTKETSRLTKHKDIVKTYSYDSAGNKSAFGVKVGDDTRLSLRYAYDGESKLTSVMDGEGNEVADYAYDAEGNLSKRTVARSRLTTAYTYDYQNRLTAMKNQADSAGVISEYTSEYLVNGKKSKETANIVNEQGKKTARTATYAYDLLGRIRKETRTGEKDITYTYDSRNNRKEMKVGNKITAYKYNQNNELLRTDTLNTDTEKDSVVIYKNDKNGNQLATVNRYDIPADKKDGAYIDIDVTLGDNRLNENVVNHYDALNQLTQTLTKNYKVSFTYDAEGLRTSKTVNGKKTVFVWDGDQIVMELSEGGKVQKRYIRGNDQGYGHSLVYTDNGTGTEKQYYVMNPHGDVVQLTDESGKVIKAYEYDSFGNEVKPDQKDENPFRYCGEYLDKETGEVYLRARYYQPGLGRFLTRDSYTGEEDDPTSLHLYTYCENDGVNNVDPSGHWGAVIHQKMTIIIARSLGFSSKDAKLIGRGAISPDRRYPFNTKKYWEANINGLSSKLTIKDIRKIANIPVITSYNYNKKKGKWIRESVAGVKPKMHQVKKKMYKKVMKLPKKITKEKSFSYKKKLVVLGAWLHVIQDRWSHGYLNKKSKRKHTNKSDNYMYDYKKGEYVIIKKSKLLKKKGGNTRLQKTISETQKYLKNWIKNSKGKKKLNKGWKRSKLNKEIMKILK